MIKVKKLKIDCINATGKIQKGYLRIWYCRDCSYHPDKFDFLPIERERDLGFRTKAIFSESEDDYLFINTRLWKSVSGKHGWKVYKDLPTLSEGDYLTIGFKSKAPYNPKIYLLLQNWFIFLIEGEWEKFVEEIKKEKNNIIFLQHSSKRAIVVGGDIKSFWDNIISRNDKDCPICLAENILKDRYREVYRQGKLTIFIVDKIYYENKNIYCIRRYKSINVFNHKIETNGVNFSKPFYLNGTYYQFAFISIGDEIKITSPDHQDETLLIKPTKTHLLLIEHPIPDKNTD